MTRGTLLERLRDLETELHRLETRKNKKRLEQLLHPDLVEFGRSGRRYSRNEVLAEFSTPCAVLESIYVERFELAQLTGGAALVTYLSAHKAATGELSRHTLRSSVWVETATGWQLRFHQGTPADVLTSD